MYGLKQISNGYIPDGSGRDTYMTRDAEVRFGRSQPADWRTASRGRECHPKKCKGVPSVPSRSRVQQMIRGQWQCTGQWCTTSRSASHAVRKTKTILQDKSGLCRSHSSSMATWNAARTQCSSSQLVLQETSNWVTQSNDPDRMGKTLPAEPVARMSLDALGLDLVESAGDRATWGPKVADRLGYHWDGRHSPFRSLG